MGPPKDNFVVVVAFVVALVTLPALACVSGEFKARPMEGSASNRMDDGVTLVVNGTDTKRSTAACASDCCLTVTNNAYVFESTVNYALRALVRWTADTVGMTFSGTYTVYRDAANANRPYAWVIIPPGATITAFTSSVNAGGYSWTYGRAQWTNCSTSSGLHNGVVNDFCYNFVFSVAPPFLMRMEVNSTQYSPFRLRFTLSSLTNAQMTNSGGSPTGATEVLATYQSRYAPTGSSVNNVIVAYVGAVSTGVNGWFSTGWSYSYKYGDPAAVHAAVQYALPFYGTYSVGQGNGGSYSHFVGSTSHYAIDFSLPSNTPVRAARAGYVSMIQEDQSMSYAQACGTNLAGCGDVDGAQANYVYVIHSDNTMAIYIHLILNGAAVEEGQLVSVGDLVGYSGNTGNSTGPHLHFAVHRTIEIGSSGGSTSIQVTYSPGGFIPVQGQSYTNNAPAPVAAPRAPPVAAPRAPPVAPPVAAPRAPPVAPPVAAPRAPPVAPPVAAPRAPPVAAPVATPVAAPRAPPVAAPVAIPVAAPRAPPVASPVAVPVAAPRASPVGQPVAAPRASPVAQPIASPRAAPVTPTPVASPRAAPVAAPRAVPVAAPTNSPVALPSPVSPPQDSLMPQMSPTASSGPAPQALPTPPVAAPISTSQQAPTAAAASPVIRVSFSVSGSPLTQSESDSLIPAIAQAVATHYNIPASDVIVTITNAGSGAYVATISFASQSSVDVVRNAGQTRAQAVQDPVLVAIRNALSSSTAPVDTSGASAPVAPRVALTNVEISGLTSGAPSDAGGNSSSGLPIPIIAGAAAGGVVLIAAIVVTIVVIKKRKSSSPSTPRGAVASSTPIETEIMSREKIEAIANGGSSPRGAPPPPSHTPAPPSHTPAPPAMRPPPPPPPKRPN